MCLSCVKKGLREFVKGLEIREDGYVWLWKVFDLDCEENLISQYHNYRFYEGKNTAEGTIVKTYRGTDSKRQYKPGFHCLTSKKEAEMWADKSLSTNRKRMVVPIKVKKSWITSYGTQGVYPPYAVVVCKHIII